MKPLSVIIVGALLIVSIVPQTASGWSIAPSVETGHYWAYDDESDPPFAEPELDPIENVLWHEIYESGTMIPPYNDSALAYPLPDSFWYYGHWYTPDDSVYISMDGWVSFDLASASGFPDPPLGTPFPANLPPNALIAPLWQQMDPRDDPHGPDRRIYYLFYEAENRLIIEWYLCEGMSSGNWFWFEVIFDLGGQELLHIEQNPDRVVFSEHFIHFLYNTTSAGWDADNLHDPPAVGLENQDGTKGIYYQGELVNGRVIRMGYKLSDESVEEDSEVVSDFELKAVTEGRYCRVEFSVPYSTRVKLNVFDAGGRLVKCLADAAFESGTHCLRWDGHEVSSGAYFIRMQAGECQSVSKAVLIR